jgi:hypothetical protein
VLKEKKINKKLMGYKINFLSMGADVQQWLSV